MAAVRSRFPTNELTKRDGRTREARLERRTRASLVERVGGHPTPAQLDDIERAVRLSMRIAIEDARSSSVEPERRATSTLRTMFDSLEMPAAARA